MDMASVTLDTLPTTVDSMASVRLMPSQKLRLNLTLTMELDMLAPTLVDMQLDTHPPMDTASVTLDTRPTTVDSMASVRLMLSQKLKLILSLPMAPTLDMLHLWPPTLPMDTQLTILMDMVDMEDIMVKMKRKWADARIYH